MKYFYYLVKLRCFLAHLLCAGLLTGFMLITADGQQYRQDHIDALNGLPSDHIYHVIKDRNGYLWINTNKGIVKYNGYDFKLFNLSDGLPSEDIWELKEDRQGRIWLGNASNEYGYIYNDKYYKAYVKGGNYIIYPRHTTVCDSGIIFSSSSINGDNLVTVCVEKNDTIHKYLLSDLLAGQDISFKSFGASDVLLFDQKGGVILVLRDTVYRIVVKRNAVSTKKLCVIDRGNASANTQYYTRLIDNYMVYFNGEKKSNSFYALNIADGRDQKFNLSNYGINEDIQYAHEDLLYKKYYVFTGEHIVVFSYFPEMKYESTYRIRDLVTDSTINGSCIKLFFEDDFWGKCTGSTTEGLWIDPQHEKHFIKEQGVWLENFKNVGGITDSISFWWSSSAGTLLKFEEGMKERSYAISNVGRLNALVPYHKDTFLMVSNITYFFVSSTGKIAACPREQFLGSALSILPDSDKGSCVINNKGLYTVQYKDGSYLPRQLDSER